MPDRLSHGQLPESQRTVDRYYDVGAFAIPAVGRFGNSHMWPLEGVRVPLFVLTESGRRGDFQSPIGTGDFLDIGLLFRIVM